MVGVQIRLVKKRQIKRQETNCTILMYKSEIIFVSSFISIGSFSRPRCFRKEACNFEHFKPRKPPLYGNFDLPQISPVK